MLLMMLKHLRLNFASALYDFNYQIKVLTNEHRKQALKMMQKQFFRSQPTQLAFYKYFPQQKINSHLYWDRVQNVFGDPIFCGGFSFGCFDVGKGNQLVGAMFAKDNGFVPAIDPSPQRGTFLYAVHRLKQKMLSQISPQYQEIINNKDIKIIDLWLSTVEPQHRQRGILQKILKIIENEGVKRQYRYATSWATNPATAACHKKMDYIKLAEVNAKQFEHNGVKYFRQLKEQQTYQSFWIKELKWQQIL